MENDTHHLVRREQSEFCPLHFCSVFMIFTQSTNMNTAAEMYPHQAKLCLPLQIPSTLLLHPHLKSEYYFTIDAIHLTQQNSILFVLDLCCHPNFHLVTTTSSLKSELCLATAALIK